jgi:hypothetical protein
LPICDDDCLVDLTKLYKVLLETCVCGMVGQSTHEDLREGRVLLSDEGGGGRCRRHTAVGANVQGRNFDGFSRGRRGGIPASFYFERWVRK